MEGRYNVLLLRWDRTSSDVTGRGTASEVDVDWDEEQAG
jgi:hypothetical protein